MRRDLLSRMQAIRQQGVAGNLTNRHNTMFLYRDLFIKYPRRAGVYNFINAGKYSVKKKFGNPHYFLWWNERGGKEKFNNWAFNL